MNNSAGKGDDMREKKLYPERREYPGSVWVLVCMDEDIDYGGNVIALGMVGSGITHLGGGNQDLFPDEKRELLRRVGGVVVSQLSSLVGGRGDAFVVTSHDKCGGASAQGFPADEVADETRRYCDDNQVEYLGHIPQSAQQVEVGNSNVGFCLTRQGHRHEGRRVVFTVGGGITEAELQELESDSEGDAFVVSADVLAKAVSDGKISENDAIAYLRLHLDIADGIADNLIINTAPNIFDGGRLDSSASQQNRQLVERMISKL